MKLRHALLTAATTMAVLAPLGHAQRMENIVVTSQRIEQDGYRASAPAITLKARADEVLVEISLITGTLDTSERRGELRKSFDLIRKAVDARDDLSLDGGTVEEIYPIETVSPDDLISNYGQRGSLDLVLRVRVGAEDIFPDIVQRAEDFADALELDGRVQVDIEDEQYLSLDDPRAYRLDLLKSIASDITTLQTMFRGQAEISGLQSSLVSRPSGALEIELYIPYSLVMHGKR